MGQVSPSRELTGVGPQAGLQRGLSVPLHTAVIPGSG